MTRTYNTPVNNPTPPIGVEIHSVQRDTKGNVRFKLRFTLPDGSEIDTSGWRYFPETDELKPPCYRVGKGWQPTGELKGPILEELREGVRALAEEKPDETDMKRI